MSKGKRIKEIKNKRKDTRINKKSKSKLWVVILCAILLIIVVLGALAGSFISGKLSHLTFEGLDETDLDINMELYNQVSDALTKREFKAIKNILFFGIDSMNPEFEGDEGRSDSIIIVSINPKYNSLKFISIPRDTYADVSGYGKTKINHAYFYGKEQLAVKTINSTFGLDITEYATVDFSALIHIINAIGGIELDIVKEEMQFINDSSKLAYSVSGRTKKTLTSYGRVTLDGEQALTHSRNRKFWDDFDRAERQRKVLEAMLSKLLQLNMKGMNEHVDLLLKEVKTNINIASYIGTATNFVLNKNEYTNNITSTQIPSKDSAKGQYIDGTYYFVPNDAEQMKRDMINTIYRK